jgi:transposase-like protein
LTEDREQLLAFFSFPADHWKHLRTTNPIESTFATVKLDPLVKTLRPEEAGVRAVRGA